MHGWRSNYTKSTLMYASWGSWLYRPPVLQCVADNVGPKILDIDKIRGKHVGSKEYYASLMGAAVVLTISE